MSTWLSSCNAAAEMAGDDDQRFDGVMVFSATTAERRERLGDEITAWLGKHPQLVPVDTVVRLSSDWRFHCLSILVFWRVVG